MAKGFNLTAEINLRGPSNIRTIVADIRRQLGTVSANVNVRIDPSTARNITTLTTAINRLNASLSDTNRIASQASTNLNTLATAGRQVSASISSLPRNIQAAATATNSLQNGVRKTASNMQVARTEFEEFGRQAALATRRAVAFSVAAGSLYKITGAINSATSEFIAFNKELVRVAQVTDTSLQNLGGLVREITNLSTGFGVASKDLIEISSTLAQAGLSARDTEKALKALALSALAPSFDNLNDTVEGSIALMRQFGIGAGDLESALGSINAVAAKFAVESSDIITAIQRTGGVFASASRGVSEGKDALNEFIAVFTSIRATTRESAETIATGLRTIFARIQRGDTIDALKEFGVRLTDLQGKFVGPFEAVKRLSESLNQLDPRDLRFARIVEELGGFRQIGKVIPLIQQFATAQQALAVAQKGQGSLAGDAVIAQQALAVKIARVREEFVALIRSVGQSDSFQSFVKLSLDLASALIRVADSAKSVLPALTAIAAIRGASFLTQFATGFAGGIRRAPPAGRGMATGGMVPGYGNTDTVPAMLTPGEFVIRKKAVEKIGIGNLARLNRNAGGPIQYLNSGGLVQRFARGGATNKTKNNKQELSSVGPTEFTHIAARITPDQFSPQLKKYFKSKKLNVSGIYSNLGLDLPKNWNRNWDLPKDNKGAFARTLANYIRSNDVFKTLKSGNNKKWRFTGRGDSVAQQLLADSADQIRSKLSQKTQNLSNFFDIDGEVSSILPNMLRGAIQSVLPSKQAKNLISGFEEKSAYKVGPQRKPVTQQLRNQLKTFGGYIQRLVVGGAAKATQKPATLSPQNLIGGPGYLKKGEWQEQLNSIITKNGFVRIPGSNDIMVGDQKVSLSDALSSRTLGAAKFREKIGAGNIVKLEKLRADLGSAYAGKRAGVVEEQRPRTAQEVSDSQARGLLFGAAGMYGTRFPAQKIAFSQADGLNSQVNATVFGALLDRDEAERQARLKKRNLMLQAAGVQENRDAETQAIKSAPTSKGLSKFFGYRASVRGVSKANKQLAIDTVNNIAQSLSPSTQGSQIFLDFDKTLAFGADKIGPKINKKKPNYAAFGDTSQVAAGLNSAKLSSLGSRLKKLVADLDVKSPGLGNELLRRMFVVSARPQQTMPLIARWLRNQGLRIPPRNVTGVGGAGISASGVGIAKAEQILKMAGAGSVFIDDDATNIEAARSKGINSIQYGSRITKKAKKQAAQQEGLQFEQFISEQLPAKLKTGIFGTSGEGIDFPSGLGADIAQNWFKDARLANIPVDTKRTLTGPRGKIKDNILNYLKAKGYNSGGKVKRFAEAGPVQPYYGQEEVEAARAAWSKFKSTVKKAYDSQNVYFETSAPKSVAPGTDPEVYGTGIGKLAKGEPGVVGSKRIRLAREKITASTDPREAARRKAVRKQDELALAALKGIIGGLPEDKQREVAQMFGLSPGIGPSLMPNLGGGGAGSAEELAVAKQGVSAFKKTGRLNFSKQFLDFFRSSLASYYLELKQASMMDPSDADLKKQLKKTRRAGVDIRRSLRTDSPIEVQGRRTAAGETLNLMLKERFQGFSKGGSPQDTVPALLTPGEFVINKKAAARIGASRLHQLNRADRVQGFNKGGMVGVQKLAGGGRGAPGDFEARIQNILQQLEQFEKNIYAGARAAGQTATQARQTSQVATRQKMVAMTQDARQPVYGPLPKGQSLQKAEQNRQSNLGAVLQAASRYSDKTLQNQQQSAQASKQSAGFFDKIKGAASSTATSVGGFLKRMKGPALSDEVRQERASNRQAAASRGMAIAFAAPMIADQIGSAIGGKTGAGISGATSAFSTAFAVGSQFTMLGPAGPLAGAIAGTVMAIDGYNNAVKEKEKELNTNNIEQESKNASKNLDILARDPNNRAASQAVMASITSMAAAEESNMKLTAEQRKPTMLQRAGSFLSFGMYDPNRRSDEDIARIGQENVTMNRAAADTAMSLLTSKVNSGIGFEEALKATGNAALIKKQIAQGAGGKFATREADLMLQREQYEGKTDANSQKALAVLDKQIEANREAAFQAETAILKAADADIQRAKASTKLVQAINVASVSIDRTFKNMEGALNAASSSLSAGMEQLDAMANNKMAKASFSQQNVLENPYSYSTRERQSAVKQASGFFGQDAGFVVKLTEVSSNIKDTMAKMTTQAQQQPGQSKEATAENIQRNIDQQLRNSFGDNNLSRQISQQLKDALDNQIRNKDSKEIDFDKLMSETTGLNTLIEAEQKAFNLLADATKFASDSLNAYREQLDKAASMMSEANNIITESIATNAANSFKLTEMLGGQVSLGERFSARQAEGANRAGVKASDYNIKGLLNRLNTLNTTRSMTQGDMNTFAGKNQYTDSRTLDTLRSFTASIVGLDSDINRTRESIKNLPKDLQGFIDDTFNSMQDKIGKMEAKQQAGASFGEKMVTSTPTELMNLNRTYDLITNTLNGQVRTMQQSIAAQQAYTKAIQDGSTEMDAMASAQEAFANENKNAFGMFSELLSIAGVEKQQANSMRADFLENMARSQGLNVQNSPFFKTIIESLRKAPEDDPQIKTLRDTVKILMDQQREASEAAAQIARDDASKLVKEAGTVIKSAIEQTRIKFDEQQLRSIGLGISTPGQVMNREKGGLVYASSGKFIPKGTDTVPAMLTPGEFVVNAKSTKNNLPLLQSINKNKGDIVGYFSAGTADPILRPNTGAMGVLRRNSVLSSSDSGDDLRQQYKALKDYIKTQQTQYTQQGDIEKLTRFNEWANKKLIEARTAIAKSMGVKPNALGYPAIKSSNSSRIKDIDSYLKQIDEARNNFDRPTTAKPVNKPTASIPKSSSASGALKSSWNSIRDWITEGSEYVNRPGRLGFSADDLPDRFTKSVRLLNFIGGSSAKGAWKGLYNLFSSGSIGGSLGTLGLGLGADYALGKAGFESTGAVRIGTRGGIDAISTGAQMSRYGLAALTARIYAELGIQSIGEIYQAVSNPQQYIKKKEQETQDQMAAGIKNDTTGITRFISNVLGNIFGNTIVPGGGIPSSIGRLSVATGGASSDVRNMSIGQDRLDAMTSREINKPKDDALSSFKLTPQERAWVQNRARIEEAAGRGFVIVNKDGKDIELPLNKEGQAILRQQREDSDRSKTFKEERYNKEAAQGPGYVNTNISGGHYTPLSPTRNRSAITKEKFLRSSDSILNSAVMAQKEEIAANRINSEEEKKEAAKSATRNAGVAVQRTMTAATAAAQNMGSSAMNTLGMIWRGTVSSWSQQTSKDRAASAAKAEANRLILNGQKADRYISEPAIPDSTLIERMEQFANDKADKIKQLNELRTSITNIESGYSSLETYDEKTKKYTKYTSEQKTEYLQKEREKEKRLIDEIDQINQSVINTNQKLETTIPYDDRMARWDAYRKEERTQRVRAQMSARRQAYSEERQKKQDQIKKILSARNTVARASGIPMPAPENLMAFPKWRSSVLKVIEDRFFLSGNEAKDRQLLSSNGMSADILDVLFGGSNTGALTEYQNEATLALMSQETQGGYRKYSQRDINLLRMNENDIVKLHDRYNRGDKLPEQRRRELERARERTYAKATWNMQSIDRLVGEAVVSNPGKKSAIANNVFKRLIRQGYIQPGVPDETNARRLTALGLSSQAIQLLYPNQSGGAASLIRPRNNSRGGVIYASKGQYVNFEPKGTDTVPAMLTPGEFVVNAKATAEHLPLLKAINNGGATKAYSKGGSVYLQAGGRVWTGPYGRTGASQEAWDKVIAEREAEYERSKAAKAAAEALAAKRAAEQDALDKASPAPDFFRDHASKRFLPYGGEGGHAYEPLQGRAQEDWNTFQEQSNKMKRLLLKPVFAKDPKDQLSLQDIQFLEQFLNSVKNDRRGERWREAIDTRGMGVRQLREAQRQGLTQDIIGLTPERKEAIEWLEEQIKSRKDKWTEKVKEGTKYPKIFEDPIFRPYIESADLKGARSTITDLIRSQDTRYTAGELGEAATWLDPKRTERVQVGWDKNGNPFHIGIDKVDKEVLEQRKDLFKTIPVPKKDSPKTTASQIPKQSKAAPVDKRTSKAPERGFPLDRMPTPYQRAAAQASTPKPATRANSSQDQNPRLRRWTDSTGTHSTSAELLSIQGDKVTIKKADGKSVTVPINWLSKSDRDYITQQSTTAPRFPAPPRAVQQPNAAVSTQQPISGQKRSPTADDYRRQAHAMIADLNARRNKAMGEVSDGPQTEAEIRRLLDLSNRMRNSTNSRSYQYGGIVNYLQKGGQPRQAVLAEKRRLREQQKQDINAAKERRKKNDENSSRGITQIAAIIRNITDNPDQYDIFNEDFIDESFTPKNPAFDKAKNDRIIGMGGQNVITGQMGDDDLLKQIRETQNRVIFLRNTEQAIGNSLKMFTASDLNVEIKDGKTVAAVMMTQRRHARQELEGQYALLQELETAIRKRREEILSSQGRYAPNMMYDASVSEELNRGLMTYRSGGGMVYANTGGKICSGCGGSSCSCQRFQRGGLASTKKINQQLAKKPIDKDKSRIDLNNQSEILAAKDNFFSDLSKYTTSAEGSDRLSDTMQKIYGNVQIEKGDTSGYEGFTNSAGNITFDRAQPNSDLFRHELGHSLQIFSGGLIAGGGALPRSAINFVEKATNDASYDAGYGSHNLLSNKVNEVFPVLLQYMNSPKFSNWGGPIALKHMMKVMNFKKGGVVDAQQGGEMLDDPRTTAGASNKPRAFKQFGGLIYARAGRFIPYPQTDLEKQIDALQNAPRLQPRSTGPELRASRATSSAYELSNPYIPSNESASNKYDRMLSQANSLHPDTNPSLTGSFYPNFKAGMDMLGAIGEARIVGSLGKPPKTSGRPKMPGSRQKPISGLLGNRFSPAGEPLYQLGYGMQDDKQQLLEVIKAAREGFKSGKPATLVDISTLKSIMTESPEIRGELVRLQKTGAIAVKQHTDAGVILGRRENVDGIRSIFKSRDQISEAQKTITGLTDHKELGRLLGYSDDATSVFDLMRDSKEFDSSGGPAMWVQEQIGSGKTMGEVRKILEQRRSSGMGFVPVSEMTIPLFRGEGLPDPNAKPMPEWLTSGNTYKKQAAAFGRWFTTSLDLAEKYGQMNDAGFGYIIKQIRTTIGEADQHRVSNLGLKPGGKDTAENPAAFSLDPTREWYLPKELSQKANAVRSGPAQRVQEQIGSGGRAGEVAGGPLIPVENIGKKFLDVYKFVEHSGLGLNRLLAEYLKPSGLTVKSSETGGVRGIGLDKLYDYKYANLPSIKTFGAWLTEQLQQSPVATSRDDLIEKFQKGFITGLVPTEHTVGVPHLDQFIADLDRYIGNETDLIKLKRFFVTTDIHSRLAGGNAEFLNRNLGDLLHSRGTGRSGPVYDDPRLDERETARKIIESVLLDTNTTGRSFGNNSQFYPSGSQIIQDEPLPKPNSTSTGLPKPPVPRGTAWEVLGIGPDMSGEEILKRYRELVKYYHTDNSNTGDSATFKRIQEAFEWFKSKNFLHRGGVVYASKGTMVPYQPKGTDTVPAMLTPGEFVVNRKATQQNLSLLKSINSGNYADGGIINYLQQGGVGGERSGKARYQDAMRERRDRAQREKKERENAYYDNLILKKEAAYEWRGKKLSDPEDHRRLSDAKRRQREREEQQQQLQKEAQEKAKQQLKERIMQRAQFGVQMQPQDSSKIQTQTSSDLGAAIVMLTDSITVLNKHIETVQQPISGIGTPIQQNTMGAPAQPNTQVSTLTSTITTVLNTFGGSITMLTDNMKQLNTQLSKTGSTTGVSNDVQQMPSLDGLGQFVTKFDQFIKAVQAINLPPIINLQVSPVQVNIAGAEALKAALEGPLSEMLQQQIKRSFAQLSAATEGAIRV